jgi:prepilin-type processing-associated H-X9-DG protein
MDARGKPSRSGRGWEVRSGSVTGRLLAVAAVLVAAVILLLPVSRGAREAARRSQCANNLKSIGRAIDAYSREHGSLPPPFSVDADGHPLHSWRVLLLPYLDDGAAAGAIDVEKRWDDPANATAGLATAEPYRCPSLRAPAGTTTYHLVVSPEGLVHSDRSATREEAASADRNTILVIESPEGRAMPWMGGGDDGVEVLMGSDEGCHAGGVMALFADGSVHFLHIGSLPLDVRRSLITPEADTPPGSFDLP